MTKRLAATLEAAIQKWLDDHLEDDDWPPTWITDNTVVGMTDAAELVFDTYTNSYQSLHDSEMLKD